MTKKKQETDAQREARQKREHFEKYDGLAQRLGVEHVKALIHFDYATLKRAHKHGKHLNLIPLARFDALHPSMLMLARATDWTDTSKKTARGFAWSLSDSVCVVKHVCRHYILNEPAPPKPQD